MYFVLSFSSASAILPSTGSGTAEKEIALGPQMGHGCWAPLKYGEFWAVPGPSPCGPWACRRGYRRGENCSALAIALNITIVNFPISFVHPIENRLNLFRHLTINFQPIMTPRANQAFLMQKLLGRNRHELATMWACEARHTLFVLRIIRHLWFFWFIYVTSRSDKDSGYFCNYQILSRKNVRSLKY